MFEHGGNRHHLEHRSGHKQLICIQCIENLDVTTRWHVHSQESSERTITGATLRREHPGPQNAHPDSKNSRKPPHTSDTNASRWRSRRPCRSFA